MAISRRKMMQASLLCAGAAFGHGYGLWAETATGPDIENTLRTIEAGTGGRLGVALLDAEGKLLAGWRQEEHFPMCSTFKVLAVSALLARVDRGEEHLDRVVHFQQSDLVPYSPETSLHVDTGMTVGEICRAAIAHSDNTAANIILASLGGPAGVTAWARHLDDAVTRLDRTETSLNEGTPGDPRDTTAPAHMAEDLRKVTTGDVLSAASRAQLTAWLEANTTGKARIRAALPAGWRIGDKTGTGDHRTANDVAVIWPSAPTGSMLPGPVFLAIYLTEAKVEFPMQEAAIASVARAFVEQRLI
ncbi:class A beta-lactamase [Silvibacterium sp.]|uniref:class A beta-lactamase n=1 Tax=Silvibacterium sp. TaxID=1964179 RepID=UPI0039E4A888